MNWNDKKRSMQKYQFFLDCYIDYLKNYIYELDD